MDPFTRTRKCRTISQNLSTTALYGHKIDLLEAMDDRDGWRERVREIHASTTVMMTRPMTTHLKKKHFTHTHTFTHTNIYTQKLA